MSDDLKHMDWGVITHPDHDKQAEILLTLIREYNISDAIARDEIKYALIRAQKSGDYLGYKRAMDEYARGC